MRNKLIGLVALSIFAMMQISACFVAGSCTQGWTSLFYYVLGGISCLFGLAFDLMLFILGINVFGGAFESIAVNMIKKDEKEEDEEELEIVEEIT